MGAIVFVHKGDSWYLWYTLRQARITNPQAAIYLIGDRHFPRYDTFATHVPIESVFSSASAFAQIYRHLSTNSHAYELFCFQRWFVLHEFMRQRGLLSLVYLDSDVMAYSDLIAEQRRFADVDLTVTKGKNPQNMFIASAAALERFCTFVADMYARQDGVLEARYAAYRAEHTEGGICDMTAFDDYRRSFPQRVTDVGEVCDGSVYDNNLRRADGFAMRRGVKYLRWVDGQPYGYPLSGDPPVRFHTLHFQGGAKLLTPYFAHQRDIHFYRQLLFHTPLRRSARGLLLLAGR